MMKNVMLKPSKDRLPARVATRATAVFPAFIMPHPCERKNGVFHVRVIPFDERFLFEIPGDLAGTAGGMFFCHGET
jgi:hypothetical protein